MSSSDKGVKLTTERPTTSNADHWLLWLDENRESGNEWLAVQIAEALDDNLASAVDRMGWPEIHAFQDEMRKGQSIYEDAGGYFMRGLRRLFGLPSPDYEVVSYRRAARAMLETSRAGEPQ